MKVIFEYQQELRDAIIELSGTDLEFDSEVVIPLVDSIQQPDSNSIVQMHSGAIKFFTPFQAPFIVENADFAALLISICVLAYSAYIQLRNLQANKQIKTLIDRIKRRKKSNQHQTKNTLVDDKQAPITPNDKGNVDDTNTLTQSLIELFKRHRALDQDFQRASTLLDHEGFRAFSEAYKSAREIVEREIEDKQRRFSSLYVGRVVSLLKEIEQHHSSLERASEQLDAIFIEASENLIKDDIFSRQSFRTFTEAYGHLD